MSKLEKLGALWIKKSKKGTDFMSGKIGEQRVVVFKVREKRENGPDFEIFKSEPMQPREDATGPFDDPWGN